VGDDGFEPPTPSV